MVKSSAQAGSTQNLSVEWHGLSALHSGQRRKSATGGPIVIKVITGPRVCAGRRVEEGPIEVDGRTRRRGRRCQTTPHTVISDEPKRQIPDADTLLAIG